MHGAARESERILRSRNAAWAIAGTWHVPWAVTLLLSCAACDAGRMGATDGPAPAAVDAGPAEDAARAPSDAGADPAPDAGALLPDAGPPDPYADRVPVFMAYGHGIHTTLSCDDGRSWVENRFEQETDDDFTHDATAAHDLLFADGWFVIQIGWGGPGRIRRSADGVSWEETFAQTEGVSLWGGASGGGVFVFGEGRRTRRSVDGAATWEPDAPVEPSASHMQIGWGDYEGGRFVVAGDAAILWSDDGGASWHPAEVPAGALGCLANKRGPVFGGGVFVINSSHGDVCRSDDGGRTWTASHLGTDDVGVPLWDGSAFWIYRYAGIRRSADGIVWETVEPRGSVTRFDALARSETTGTWLAISGGNLYRSADGIEWTREPSSIWPTGGASLSRLTFGYAEPSPACGKGV